MRFSITFAGLSAGLLFSQYSRRRHAGLHHRPFRHLVEALDLPIAPEQYLARRVALLNQRFPESPAKPGAQAFSRAAHAVGLVQGIATSSDRSVFELKVTKHRDWFSIFGCVVTGDDSQVARGKPAPDIFLRAAALLQRAPEDCLVFEDAPSGVEAALAAGMQVVALPDPAMDSGVYTGADLIAGGFEELELDDFGFG